MCSDHAFDIGRLERALLPGAGSSSAAAGTEAAMIDESELYEQFEWMWTSPADWVCHVA